MILINHHRHISMVTKKLDGVLDFGIGSKPFAAMRLDEDYAARLRSDHIPVLFQLECSQGFDFIIAGDWNARSETWKDTGSNKYGDHVVDDDDGLSGSRPKSLILAKE